MLMLFCILKSIDDSPFLLFGRITMTVDRCYGYKIGLLSS